MTDQQHPITPPPDLVEQWLKEFYGAKLQYVAEASIHLAAQAAQWGADQELEACCDHMRNHQWGFVDLPDGTKIHRAIYLQQTRRPKPPSLKEQALLAIDTAVADDRLSADVANVVRRALEQLND
jgi:hypothetical protein